MRKSWKEVAPTEFEGHKLTGVANLAYSGLPGADDAALIHPDVGSTITCGINVRKVSQAPWTLHLTLPFPS